MNDLVKEVYVKYILTMFNLGNIYKVEWLDENTDGGIESFAYEVHINNKKFILGTNQWDMTKITPETPISEILDNLELDDQNWKFTFLPARVISSIYGKDSCIVRIEDAIKLENISIEIGTSASSLGLGESYVLLGE